MSQVVNYLIRILCAKCIKLLGTATDIRKIEKAIRKTKTKSLMVIEIFTRKLNKIVILIYEK